MINYKGMKAVKVHLADNDVFEAIGRGDIVMELATPEGLKRGELKDSLYLQRLSRNLFSVSRFTSPDTSVRGLFKLKMKPVKAPSAMANLSEAKRNPSNLCRERLGHIDSQGFHALVKNKLSSDMPLKSVEEWSFCDLCALGKQDSR
ncbi:hypothetical protein Ae201684P_001055 [Aphanomyces euteiches]|nr:hypothetical protein Ae201684P_001055 [Aphanomyces euteiches]